MIEISIAQAERDSLPFEPVAQLPQLFTGTAVANGNLGSLFAEHFDQRRIADTHTAKCNPFAFDGIKKRFYSAVHPNPASKRGLRKPHFSPV